MTVKRHRAAAPFLHPKERVEFIRLKLCRINAKRDKRHFCTGSQVTR